MSKNNNKNIFKFKNNEQSILRKGYFMSFIGFGLIFAIMLGFVYPNLHLNWLPKFTKELSENGKEPYITFKGAIMFSENNYIIGTFFWSSILMVIIAIFIQPIWTKSIEKITKRHTITLFIIYIFLIGVAGGMFSLSTRFRYIYIFPFISSSQYLFKWITGFFSKDIDYYRPYLFADISFIVIFSVVAPILYLYYEPVNLNLIYWGLPIAIFNAIFNKIKYRDIVMSPEWDSLMSHKKKYKLLVQLWIGFKLTSDWSSLWLTNLIDKSRLR